MSRKIYGFASGYLNKQVVTGALSNKGLLSLTSPFSVKARSPVSPGEACRRNNITGLMSTAIDLALLPSSPNGSKLLHLYVHSGSI
jgi:hypothetical protein